MARHFRGIYENPNPLQTVLITGIEHHEEQMKISIKRGEKQMRIGIERGSRRTEAQGERHEKQNKIGKNNALSESKKKGWHQLRLIKSGHA